MINPSHATHADETINGCTTAVYPKASCIICLARARMYVFSNDAKFEKVNTYSLETMLLHVLGCSYQP